MPSSSAHRTVLSQLVCCICRDEGLLTQQTSCSREGFPVHHCSLVRVSVWGVHFLPRTCAPLVRINAFFSVPRVEPTPQPESGVWSALSGMIFYSSSRKIYWECLWACCHLCCWPICHSELSLFYCQLGDDGGGGLWSWQHPGTRPSVPHSRCGDKSPTASWSKVSEGEEQRNRLYRTTARAAQTPHPPFFLTQSRAQSPECALKGIQLSLNGKRDWTLLCFPLLRMWTIIGLH